MRERATQQVVRDGGCGKEVYYDNILRSLSFGGNRYTYTSYVPSRSGWGEGAGEGEVIQLSYW